MASESAGVDRGTAEWFDPEGGESRRPPLRGAPRGPAGSVTVEPPFARIERGTHGASNHEDPDLMTSLDRIGSLLGRAGVPSMFRMLRPGLRVVLYHHVGKEDDFTRHLRCTNTEEAFERHVDWYRRNYDLVSMDDVLSDDPLPRRALLITFDDAYRSVLETAGPILKSRSVPATLFLVTDPVFEGRMILDNLLSYAQSRNPSLIGEVVPGRSEDPVREILLDEIPHGGLEARRRIREAIEAGIGADAWREANDSGLYLRSEDVPRLRGCGISIARHTASHANLRLVEDLRSEVVDSWEGAGLDSTLRSFSFPFGSFDDAEPSVAELSRLGLGPLFLVEGCVNRGRSRIYYRTSVGDLDERSLAVELELKPVLRTLRKSRRMKALEAVACG